LDQRIRGIGKRLGLTLVPLQLREDEAHAG
jgi:hypothetical protein